jgi:Tyrosine phosphatase family
LSNQGVKLPFKIILDLKSYNLQNGIFKIYFEVFMYTHLFCILAICLYCHPAIADEAFAEDELIAEKFAIDAPAIIDIMEITNPGVPRIPPEIILALDTEAITESEAVVDGCKGQNFNPKMVYLLDVKNNVYLFRGNMPQMNCFFDYSDLTARIAEILAEKHITLPSNYRLIDLSFLNEQHNGGEIEVEHNWFLVNPATGSLWVNPLRGTIIDPLYLPAFMRNLIIEYHDFDGLKTLIPHLKHLMEQAADRDTVIYMHCDEGKDRTGGACACYLMQYLGYSYTEALALDDKIAGRPVHEIFRNAIRWYAFYLRDFLGVTTVGLIEGE